MPGQVPRRGAHPCATLGKLDTMTIQNHHSIALVGLGHVGLPVADAFAEPDEA